MADNSTDRVFTTMRLPRDAYEALRSLAYQRAVTSGTRINVSAVIADLARAATVSPSTEQPAA
jgi:hypothetical protein